MILNYFPPKHGNKIWLSNWIWNYILSFNEILCITVDSFLERGTQKKKSLAILFQGTKVLVFIIKLKKKNSLGESCIMQKKLRLIFVWTGVFFNNSHFILGPGTQPHWLTSWTQQSSCPCIPSAGIPRVIHCVSSLHAGFCFRAPCLSSKPLSTPPASLPPTLIFYQVHFI